MGMFFEVVVGGVVVSNGILLFGFHRTSRTDFPVLLKLYAGQDSSDDAQFVNIDWRDQTLQVFGGDSTLSANTVVRISAAVVRGEPGSGGGGGGGTSLSDAEIKQKYEANADTNAFTDAAVAKLGGIAVGATANSDASINALITAAMIALAARVTRLEGFHPSAGTHTRIAAISADVDLGAAEVAAGETSMDANVMTPTWGDGELRYLFIGVPTGENDISDILQSGISVFSGYEAHAAEVSGHKWWRSRNALDGGVTSGITLQIVQA